MNDFYAWIGKILLIFVLVVLPCYGIYGCREIEQQECGDFGTCMIISYGPIAKCYNNRWYYEITYKDSSGTIRAELLNFGHFNVNDLKGFTFEYGVFGKYVVPIHKLDVR